MNITQNPTHARNLSAWFVTKGPSADPAPDYLTLEEAMESLTQILHETGNVNQLLVENPTDRDLFIQAGDIVKGGRQDRTLGTDFIVPARSGKIPVPAFCVESGRWHRRRGEADTYFSKSSDFTSSKQLRAAIHLKKQQGAVWNAVQEDQTKLSESVGAHIVSPDSPTSLQLSYEHDGLKNVLDDYLTALPSTPPPDTIGVAWSINGRPSHADIYGSPILFHKLWNKLRRAAALEAISDRTRPSEVASSPIDNAAISAWLANSQQAEAHNESLPPRTRVATLERPDQVRLETHDTEVPSLVHMSVLAR